MGVESTHLDRFYWNISKLGTETIAVTYSTGGSYVSAGTINVDTTARAMIHGLGTSVSWYDWLVAQISTLMTAAVGAGSVTSGYLGSTTTGLKRLDQKWGARIDFPGVTAVRLTPSVYGLFNQFGVSSNIWDTDSNYLLTDIVPDGLWILPARYFKNMREYEHNLVASNRVSSNKPLRLTMDTWSYRDHEYDRLPGEYVRENALILESDSNSMYNTLHNLLYAERTGANIQYSECTAHSTSSITFASPTQVSIEGDTNLESYVSDQSYETQRERYNVSFRTREIQ